jgi:tetratricopeptide (TPR) repeat protein
MNARQKTAWAAIAGVPALLVALALLQFRIDTTTEALGEQKEELLLRSAKTIKRLSLGYDGLLADMYWTRAVQYYGTYAGIPGSKFTMLWPLLDIATTLDPKLTPAYRFGAVFLSEPSPVGAGQADRAIELTERGIRENPDDWRMDASLGFLYYWYEKNYTKASEVYLAGSKKADAPGWLAMMAARMASKADAVETSKMIWSEIYNSSTNDSVRNNALQHLEGLQALEDIRQLDEIAEKYKSVYGHYPATGEDLVRAGVLQKIPADPTGVPYVYSEDGKASVGPTSSVIPEKPPATPPTEK